MRNSYTHAAFAKQLDAATEIRQNGARIWSRFLAKYVTVGDLLPERIALALDDKGNVVDQREFSENYRMYLTGFGLPKRDPALEPIPSVLSYLLMSVDTAFPEHDGRFVELGYSVDAVSTDEPEITVPVVEVQSGTEEAPVEFVEMTTAPCGKEVKKRGLHMHKLRCGQPECASLREMKTAEVKH